MHYVNAKGLLSPSNGMNIFRGCTHGCIYCDSRSKCYHIEHSFEDIEVKENAPSLLEKALKSKKSRCVIGTGSMTDPYLPQENEIFYTRKCLEIIDKYSFGLTLITKSNLVLRDLELLKSINSKATCVVQMTLTTFDDDLCKILEPNVATTKERFDTLLKLKEAGIPTVVWICPILPFINDTEENLLGILDYCAKAGVVGIINFGMGLTLRDGNREYFYQKLDEHFPSMKEKYMEQFGNSYSCESPNNPALMRIFKKFCIENKIMYSPEKIFEYLHKFEDKLEKNQLSFF